MPNIIPFLENLYGMGYPVVGGAFVAEVDIDLDDVVWIEDNTTTGGAVVRVDFSTTPTSEQITNTEASGATWDFRDRVPRSLTDVYNQIVALSPEDHAYMLDVVSVVVLTSAPSIVEASGLPIVVYDYVDP